MQKRRQASYLGMLLPLCLTGTCAPPPESMVILVNVKGLTADVVALSVELTFNGTKKQLADVKSNLNEFAITLPNRDDQRGQLQIAVAATATGLCKVSSGSTKLSTDAGPLYSVDVTLAALPTPQCTLVLDVLGTGTVRGVAGSSTQSCTGHCSFDYPVGTNVMLSASTTPGNLPGLWSGDCGGSATNPCLLVMQRRNSVATTFARLCFGPVSSVPGLNFPSSAAVADFNGDKKIDLAVANSGDNRVSVLLGNGVGDLVSAMGSPFIVGSTPYAIAMGDFNGDTKPDLAVANRNNNNVSVLLGNGTGSFAAAMGSPFTVGTNPSSVAVGDFNGDTKPDLAVANTNSNNVSVLLGNGTGSFATAMGSPSTVGTNPAAVVVGDFNGDTKLDVVVANTNSNNLSVLLGNGMGSFAAAMGSPFTAGTNPTAVAVGDFNGDTKPDLAVANLNSNNVSVLLGNGMGSFAAAMGSPFRVGSTPFAVAVGDA